MKKIKMLFFVFSVLLASNCTTLPFFEEQKSQWKEYFDYKPTPQWKKFFQQYITSIGVGACLGITVDVITDYFFEQIAPHARKTMARELLLWFIKSYYLKPKLLQEVIKDMRQYNIPYKDSLLRWTAHLTPFRNILKDIHLYVQGDYYRPRW